MTIVLVHVILDCVLILYINLGSQNHSEINHLLIVYVIGWLAVVFEINSENCEGCKGVAKHKAKPVLFPFLSALREQIPQARNPITY